MGGTPFDDTSGRHALCTMSSLIWKAAPADHSVAPDCANALLCTPGPILCCLVVFFSVPVRSLLAV